MAHHSIMNISDHRPFRKQCSSENKYRGSKLSVVFEAHSSEDSAFLLGKSVVGIELHLCAKKVERETSSGAKGTRNLSVRRVASVPITMLALADLRLTLATCYWRLNEGTFSFYQNTSRTYCFLR